MEKFEYMYRTLQQVIQREGERKGRIESKSNIFIATNFAFITVFFSNINISYIKKLAKLACKDGVVFTLCVVCIACALLGVLFIANSQLLFWKILKVNSIKVFEIEKIDFNDTKFIDQIIGEMEDAYNSAFEWNQDKTVILDKGIALSIIGIITLFVAMVVRIIIEIILFSK